MKRRAKQLLNDLDQEIREHIELATQENIDRGMTPTEARYAALRKFGNVTRVKEDVREVWSTVWLEQLGQDIRFTLRQLRKIFLFEGTHGLQLGQRRFASALAAACFQSSRGHLDQQSQKRLEPYRSGGTRLLGLERSGTVLRRSFSF